MRQNIEAELTDSRAADLGAGRWHTESYNPLATLGFGLSSHDHSRGHWTEFLDHALDFVGDAAESGLRDAQPSPSNPLSLIAQKRSAGRWARRIGATGR